ncbi:MAG: replicative DNA helicase [Thiomargarita sp.]|nr:replicative DNA helicase [Thiomargarita sp.]
MQEPSNNPQAKSPPFSREAEQSVLGGIIINNDAWISVADLLIETDFFLPEHRTLFRAIKSLSEENQPCDSVTLAGWLDKNNKLKSIGGGAYLGHLTGSTPSAANIKAYADIVRERSILRHLMNVGTEITASAYNPEGRHTTELLDNAEKLVFEIAELGARTRAGFVRVSDILPQTLDQIDRLSQQEGTVTGISTGFTDFDVETSGLQPSDLIIVAGRPSMGKTSFAMNVAEHVAVNEQKTVAVFSMEMSNEQLIMRLIASLARINLQNVRTGKLEDNEWDLMTEAVEKLQIAPLFIDETPALSPTELRAKVRRLAREEGQLGLIVIDYIQLMQVPSNKENRTTEVSEISRSLKSLAKELNVPVMALSQLNRSLEQRTDKRPKMSDLRESGSIEQDADLITFIYRDEVYNENSPDQGVAEIIIAKQRNGPVGTTRLFFQGVLTKFENYISNDHYHGE